MRAPHWERKPPVTLRKITLGRRARSHSLLVAGTSRRGMKTKRSPRHLRVPRASCLAGAGGDEDKEITAAFADTAGELLAGVGGGADGEQPVKSAVEVGTVLDQGGVLEIGFCPRGGEQLQKITAKSWRAGRAHHIPRIKCPTLTKY